MNRLKVDKDAETKRLLAAQSTELQQHRAPLLEDIARLEAQVDGLKTQHDELVGKREVAKTDVQSVDIELTTKRHELGILDAQVLENVQDLKAVSGRTTAKQQEYVKLEGKYNELLDIKTSLITDIATLKSQRVTEGSELAQALESAETALKQKNEEIVKANQKLKDMQIEVLTTEKQLTIERKELANRQRALEDRDKNLRLREFKVNQDETTIRTNASLLDL